MRDFRITPNGDVYEGEIRLIGHIACILAEIRSGALVSQTNLAVGEWWRKFLGGVIFETPQLRPATKSTGTGTKD